METSKVFTTAGFRGLSTDRALIRKGKLFRPCQNQGRIREVGLAPAVPCDRQVMADCGGRRSWKEGQLTREWTTSLCTAADRNRPPDETSAAQSSELTIVPHPTTSAGSPQHEADAWPALECREFGPTHAVGVQSLCADTLVRKRPRSQWGALATTSVGVSARHGPAKHLMHHHHLWV
jgi:hypothetical protein